MKVSICANFGASESGASQKESSLNMADTGEDREIKRRANANAAETIRESKKLTEKMKQRAAKRTSRTDAKGSGQSKPRS